MRLFRYLAGLVFILFVFENYSLAAYTVTPFETQYLCAYTYNSDTTVVNFSINETYPGDFTKNQTDKTIIFDLPAGFKFDTTCLNSSVIRSLGGDITACSFVFFNTGRIIVTLSVLGDDYTDTLYFDNFQIYAAEAEQSGSLLRNGGTFKINHHTDNPSESLGDLISDTPMSYSSSTATHTNFADVHIGSQNNEILQIAITIDGTCDPVTITHFKFDTYGDPGTDNPSNDLCGASVFYTGTSNTFTTDNHFGSITNAPDGTFSITGSREPDPGTVYFWLTYDISPDAISGNHIDAHVDSLLINGVWITDITEADPENARIIAPVTEYYSIADGNWTDGSIWSLVSHTGTSCDCSPADTGFVKIAHSVTMNSSQTTDLLLIEDGGILSSSNKTLTINLRLSTQGSGYFSFTKEITVNGDMILSGTGTSQNSKPINISRNLKVGQGSTLSMQNNLFVGGNLIIDGTINMNNKSLTLTGNSPAISNSGSGTVNGSGTFKINGEDATFTSGTILEINPALEINGAYSITNYGNITLNNDLNGKFSGSTWINSENATLSISGNLLTTGKLAASEDENSINYFNNGNQNIKTPETSYFDLVLSGSGTKKLTGNTNISGDLMISAACLLDVAGLNYTIFLGGNWINTGTNADPFLERNGKVIFNGSEQQSISSLSSETFNDLEISAGSDVSVQSSTNISVDGILTVNGSFTLKSDATTTAQLLDNGIINGSGNTTVERFVCMNAWHYISCPISDGTSNMITGEGQNFYYYDETGQQWISVPNGTPLTIMKGFNIFLPWNNVVQEFTGTPNTGSQSISITNDGNNWNLVGNPYPSAIDWSSASGWTKTNINDATYIWNQEIENFAAYVDGVGTNGGSRYIAPGQGFWVKAVGSNGTLGMNNDVRLFNSQEFRDNKELVNTLKLTVSDNTHDDETIIRFKEFASDNFDPDYDALKKYTYDYVPEIYSFTSDNTDLAISTLSSGLTYKTVPLKFKVNASGTYSLMAEYIDSFDESTTIYLEDIKESIWTDIRQTNIYSFSYTANDDLHRFNIHFSFMTTDVDEEIECSNIPAGSLNIYSFRNNIYVKNNSDKPIDGTIKVYDITGKLITEEKLVNQTINSITLNTATGIYIVKAYTNTTVYTQKLYIW